MSDHLPPPLRRKKIIRDMDVGDVGYVMASAMVVNDDMECFLHRGHGVESEPFGPFKMRIEHRENGFHVFASKTGERWESTSVSEGSVVYIRVAEVY